MTRNTLLLAVSAFHQSWAQSVYFIVMIARFVLGVLASRGLIRFGHSPVLSLTIAAAALAICSFIGLKRASPLLGFAMGMQTATARASARPPPTRSTSSAICSDCSKRIAALIWPWRGAPPSAGIGALALVWLEYLGGGMIGGLADLSFRHALLVSAAILPFVLQRRRHSGISRQ